MIYNKSGFEFSFGWMFAIIVGAAIIFLAIYGTTKLIDTEGTIQESEVGKELGILLTPIESAGEEGKSSLITFPEEALISFTCDSRGNFGSQKIKVGNGVASTFYNKYIFSSEEVEGRELYVLSKEFKMPFKVADLMMIWSDKETYCFVNAPDEVYEEVEDLGLKNVELDTCESGGKRVCFGSGGCDVNVNTIAKSVTKKEETVYYDNTFGLGLLYGAIFSDADEYECQIQRLSKRISELSLLYIGKESFAGREGCSSTLDLVSYSNNAKIESSIEINSLASEAEELERQNDRSYCEIF